MASFVGIKNPLTDNVSQISKVLGNTYYLVTYYITYDLTKRQNKSPWKLLQKTTNPPLFYRFL